MYSCGFQVINILTQRRLRKEFNIERKSKLERYIYFRNNVKPSDDDEMAETRSDDNQFQQNNGAWHIESLYSQQQVTHGKIDVLYLPDRMK